MRPAVALGLGGVAAYGLWYWYTGGSMSSARSIVAMFPTSRSIEDLAEPFRSKVRTFLAGVKDAGGTYTIAATKRPQQRAAIMHWAWMVSKEGVNPASVPPLPGISIAWSKALADELVVAYGLAYRPALDSLHIMGQAIDVDITFQASATMRTGTGGTAYVSAGDANADPAFHRVAATYGVVKLPSDHPHYSSTGH